MAEAESVEIQKVLLKGYREANWVRFAGNAAPCVSPVEGVDNVLWGVLKYVVSPNDADIVRWLHRPNPALGGDIPMEVMKGDSGGQVVRALLMRML